MEPNPYEAPGTSNIAAIHRRGDKRKFKTGVRMAGFAFVLPILAFAGGRAFVEFAASSDPVPQGAMVVAFLVFLASLPVAAFLFAAGVGLAWVNRHS